MIPPTRLGHLRDLSARDITHRLRGGLRLRIGPYVAHFETRDRIIAALFAAHYPNYPLAELGEFADAKLVIGRNPTVGLRWITTRAIRTEDGRVFTAFPTNATLAHLEWTLNWAIANRSHDYLILHGGVLANAHGAIVFPAHPGAGKSTLCAYLMHRGWRFLSDEMVMIRDASLDIHPFPRLVPLKNESIDVIKKLVPEAKLGPRIEGTHKGTIAHLAPGDEHIAAMHQPASPRVMIFPTYRAGAALELCPTSRADCFVQITQNAFNYVLRGREGFELAAALTERVKAYHLTYSELPEADAALTELMREASLTT